MPVRSLKAPAVQRRGQRRAKAEVPVAARATRAARGTARRLKRMAELTKEVVSIHNPQEINGGKPGEGVILQWVCKWLQNRGLQPTADIAWGVHAVLTSRAGPGERPGVLLSAHLDSDHLDPSGRAVKTCRIEGEGRRGLRLCFDGEVGLDCKTGVAICLATLERLQASKKANSRPWSVHVLFTVGEESGQKGAIRFPINLIAGRVRHGLVIDRKTQGAGAPMLWGECIRHAVTAYNGIPLCDPEMKGELIRLLGRAWVDAGAPEASLGRVPTVESPNNADALELRGRWDAEAVGPWFLDLPEVLNAMAKYRKAHEVVLKTMKRVSPKTRVSGMNQYPRCARYAAMQELRAALASPAAAARVPDKMRFSCVNLSYDYADENPSCSIAELDLTAQIAVSFVRQYAFQGKQTPEQIPKRRMKHPALCAATDEAAEDEQAPRSKKRKLNRAA